MDKKEKISIGKTGKVTLTLPDNPYKKNRYLGDIKDRIFYTYKSENQLFRASNSFGINYKFLSEYGRYFDNICIEYNNRYYFTSRNYFLYYGELLYFKNNGLDKQIFLPLDMFGKEKADNFEIEQANKLLDKVRHLGNSFGAFKDTSSQARQEGLF